MTVDELRTLAEEARDLALLRQRLAFDRRYGRFTKCATCGAYLFSAFAKVITPSLCKHNTPMAHGYSFPEDLARRLDLSARVG